MLDYEKVQKFLTEREEEIKKLRAAFANHVAAGDAATDLATAVEAAATTEDSGTGYYEIMRLLQQLAPKKKEKDEVHDVIYKKLLERGAREGLEEQSWDTKRGKNGRVAGRSSATDMSSASLPPFLLRPPHFSAPQQPTLTHLWSPFSLLFFSASLLPRSPH